jgi:1-acyl-sn-glycerol-3-phosphate acyltransferase
VTGIGVAFRLLLLGLLGLALVPLHMLALRLNWSILHVVPMWFHRVLLRIFNVRVIERGAPPGDAPTIVLSNHVSWLDIPVIGSLHPLSFIAKSEIEGWPVVGLLARLQRSVFIDRRRRKATAEVNDALAHRLVRGEVIVLFAEGTTATATGSCPFAPRWWARPRRRSCMTASSMCFSSRSPSLHPPQRPAGHPARAPLHRLVRRHGSGSAPEAVHPGHPLDVIVTWGEPTPFNGNRKQATALPRPRCGGR